jgi:hypothetical protein
VTTALLDEFTSHRDVCSALALRVEKLEGSLKRERTKRYKVEDALAEVRSLLSGSLTRVNEVQNDLDGVAGEMKVHRRLVPLVGTLQSASVGFGKRLMAVEKAVVDNFVDEVEVEVMVKVEEEELVVPPSFEDIEEAVHRLVPIEDVGSADKN